MSACDVTKALAGRESFKLSRTHLWQRSIVLDWRDA